MSPPPSDLKQLDSSCDANQSIFSVPIPSTTFLNNEVDNDTNFINVNRSNQKHTYENSQPSMIDNCDDCFNVQIYEDEIEKNFKHLSMITESPKNYAILLIDNQRWHSTPKAQKNQYDCINKNCTIASAHRVDALHVNRFATRCPDYDDDDEISHTMNGNVACQDDNEHEEEALDSRESLFVNSHRNDYSHWRRMRCAIFSIALILILIVIWLALVRFSITLY